MVCVNELSADLPKLCSALETTSLAAGLPGAVDGVRDLCTPKVRTALARPVFPHSIPAFHCGDRGSRGGCVSDQGPMTWVLSVRRERTCMSIETVTYGGMARQVSAAVYCLVMDRGLVQRIGALNSERYRAARLADPMLTFDAWVDRLFRLAQPQWQSALPNSGPAKRRGRPSGATGRGVTGAAIVPRLVAFLMTRPGIRAESGEVVRRLEMEFSPLLTDRDRELTAARVPKWQHAIYSQVAYLRARGLMLPQDKNHPTVWALSEEGKKWARGIAENADHG